MNLTEAMQVADDPITVPRANLVLALVQLVQKVRSDEAHQLEADRLNACGQSSSYSHVVGTS